MIIEVFSTFIIRLVIGLATFSILRWTFTKFIKADKTRIWLPWLGTILLTPIIYFGLIKVLFGILLYQPTTDFNREKWFADKERRFEMRDDIVETGILTGKSKKEILDLLGYPDNGTDTTDIWKYVLGTSGAGFGWQFNTLLVTFDNDSVVKVEIQEIVD